MTKVEKAGIQNTELKVWCEYCSIRIAPNEEQITVCEKTLSRTLLLQAARDCHAEIVRFGSRWLLGGPI